MNGKNRILGHFLYFDLENDLDNDLDLFKVICQFEVHYEKSNIHVNIFSYLFNENSYIRT